MEVQVWAVLGMLVLCDNGGVRCVSQHVVFVVMLIRSSLLGSVALSKSLSYL